MTKWKNDVNLKSKKSNNISKRSSIEVKDFPIKHPGKIANKIKRSEMYGKYLAEKKREKRNAQLKRENEVEELGESGARPKNIPRTLENTRDIEDTYVKENDEEVLADEIEDEFSLYWNDIVKPKVMITTRPMPSGDLFAFIQNLLSWIPNSFYYPRKKYTVKEICGFATNREFTHLLVLSEKSKVCNGLIITHLGGGSDGSKTSFTKGGPTAFFKISNFIPSQSIPKHGKGTDHIPELVLNGFGTRLGHRVGRLLGSMFPHRPQFRGRQVVTYHNQRDYIFARHHR